MHTPLATSVYARMPSVKYYMKFSPQICIALEAVLLKFHVKLAPGWALNQVNFNPIQKNEWVGALS